ncbi:MAG: hypothetical protein AABZ60_00375, partial [Planctomycetota bacterium]
MNKRLLVLLFLFVPFSIISGIAVYQQGYFELWKLAFFNLGTFQIFCDLTVACTLIFSWMIRDANARGKQAWPWLILIILSGTLAILT